MISASLLEDWTPLKDGVDVALFTGGRVGPFTLGRILRQESGAIVRLALQDDSDEVAEIHFLECVRTESAERREAILADVAHVIGLRHRHVATVTGAGLAGTIPYVVHGHRLGRTLEDVLGRAPSIDLDTSASILFAVVEALGFLEDESPSPGCCSIGGLCASDVHLTFDGTLLLFGAGLRRVRCGAGDAVCADRASVFALAARLDPTHALEGEILEHNMRDTAVALRHRHRRACATSEARVGRLLRAHFADEIRSERAFFGLDTIH